MAFLLINILGKIPFNLGFVELSQTAAATEVYDTSST